MDEERGAIVRARLNKSEGKIAAARADLAAGRCDDAASRAYYAMLHAARALLAAKGLTVRSHSGLAAVFGEHFIVFWTRCTAGSSATATNDASTRAGSNDRLTLPLGRARSVGWQHCGDVVACAGQGDRGAKRLLSPGEGDVAGETGKRRGGQLAVLTEAGRCKISASHGGADPKHRHQRHRFRADRLVPDVDRLAGDERVCAWNRRGRLGVVGMRLKTGRREKGHSHEDQSPRAVDRTRRRALVAVPGSALAGGWCQVTELYGPRP